MVSAPRLYADLAHLWPALSPPDDYAAEAAELGRLLAERCGPGPLKLCEFGAGGGSTLAHLSGLGSRGGVHDVTAVDLSPEMLAVAAGHAPGLRVVVADMRTVTLPNAGRFDAVLAHDAIDYLRTEADLLATARAAAALLRPGGVFLAAPTYTAETFEPGEAADDAVLLAGGGRPAEEVSYVTRVEGSADRGVRMTISLTVRGEGGAVEEVEDIHELGLFGEAVWLRALCAAGLDAGAVESDGPWSMFVGRRPCQGASAPCRP